MSRVSSQHSMVSIQGEPLATVVYQPEVFISDVVLVHGFTGSKEDFIDMSLLLAQKGHRVLTFDNRGQHESGQTQRVDGYSMRSLGQDVIELVNAFGLSKPHLMGHSFGGLISQQATVLAPELFSSLTLFCSGPGGKPSWFDFPQFAGLTNMNKTEKWESNSSIEELSSPKYPLRKKRWLASDAVSTLAYREHLRNFTSLVDEIKDLGIPSHVIYGENDDVWPLNEQQEMAHELGAQLTVLPGCGHCPNEEKPSLTADTLSQFWKSIQ